MWKKRRRRTLQFAPFPPRWREILETRVPLYGRLPLPDRRELEGHIQVFLAEKNFEGCDGLVMTDEIRVSIAAQACLLLLHRQTNYYPELHSILVYPSQFFVKTTEHSDSGIEHEDIEARLGEAWKHGAVVLAWDAVCGGAIDPEDGYNVALHEFAHQLDFEDGAADGAPLLGGEDPHLLRGRRYRSWARVLNAEFEKLRDRVDAGDSSVLDEYGAEDPAEFFAVATESFFERPRELRAEHPELYAELKGFYRQDPAQWPAAL
jgi:hypothetical protein